MVTLIDMVTIVWRLYKLYKSIIKSLVINYSNNKWFFIFRILLNVKLNCNILVSEYHQL